MGAYAVCRSAPLSPLEGVRRLESASLWPPKPDLCDQCVARRGAAARLGRHMLTP